MAFFLINKISLTYFSFFLFATTKYSVFNTFENELWVVVTRPVIAGERLSIDYINGFYEPKEIRQETLSEQYAFQCECTQCSQGIDKPRAFHCTNCSIGPVCPVPSNNGEAYVCLQCNWIMPLAQIQTCIAYEKNFGDSNPPSNENDINIILKQNIFHVTHHFLWVSMLHIGETLAGSPMRCRDGSAIQMWSRVLEGAKYVLPNIHPVR